MKWSEVAASLVLTVPVWPVVALGIAALIEISHPGVSYLPMVLVICSAAGAAIRYAADWREDRGGPDLPPP